MDDYPMPDEPPGPYDSWDDVPRIIRSVHEFEYCPICGSKVEKKEIEISQYRSNLQVDCPEHGTLILSRA